jgi:tubulin polyglutamylase TTLL1
LITSTDPLIVHVYKKALIKRCAKPFDRFTTEKAAHVCNTAIVKKVKKNLLDEDEDDDESEIVNS